VLRDTSGRVAD